MIDLLLDIEMTRKMIECFVGSPDFYRIEPDYSAQAFFAEFEAITRKPVLIDDAWTWASVFPLPLPCMQ